MWVLRVRTHHATELTDSVVERRLAKSSPTFLPGPTLRSTHLPRTGMMHSTVTLLPLLHRGDARGHVLRALAAVPSMYMYWPSSISPCCVLPLPWRADDLHYTTLHYTNPH